MTTTRSTAVALAAVALVLAGGAATAASKSHRDVSGDVPAASADITRVTVKNTGPAVMVQTKLAKASAARTHLVITLTPTAAGAPAYVVRTVEVGHRVGATLESVTTVPAPEPSTDPTTDPSTDPSASATPTTTTVSTPVSCPKIKASVSRGRHGMVTVRVPQSCLGADAGTLLVQVATQTPAQVESGTDETTDESATLRVKRG